MVLINNVINQWTVFKRETKMSHVIKLYTKEKLVSKVLVTQSLGFV